MRIGHSETMANKAAKKARTSRTAGRRHPLASVALILIGLLSTGGAYALFTTTASAETATTSMGADQVDDGSKLFAANCATCHGLSLEGTTEGPWQVAQLAAKSLLPSSTWSAPMLVVAVSAEAVVVNSA